VRTPTQVNDKLRNFLLCRDRDYAWYGSEDSRLRTLAIYNNDLKGVRIRGDWNQSVIGCVI
jgi:hypothetical protein